MRALLISWEYPPVIEGGLGRHVRKLSEQLAREGVEVHVLTRGGGRLARQEERHGVFIHRVREPPFPSDVGAFLKWVAAMNRDMAMLARKLRRANDFDLVHSHDWLVSAVAGQTARRLGIPWLVTVHATEHGRHQGWVEHHPQSHIHALERRMIRRADHVITCSEFMRDHVVKVFGADPHRVSVILNGIDAAELRPGTDDLPGLRARFAQPSEKLVVLVGRLVYEKGFHLALDALASVAAQLGDVRFVVAGSGAAERDLKRQARRPGLAGRGTFLGWVGDDMLHALYRIAEVCIVPSIYEPFGLVALEAMASGCPCVVADTGGLREVVPGDGIAGLRFRAGDSRSLAGVLTRILADEGARAQLAVQARAHVLGFGWVEIAQRTAEDYRQLVERGPRARRPVLSGPPEQPTLAEPQESPAIAGPPKRPACAAQRSTK